MKVLSTYARALTVDALNRADEEEVLSDEQLEDVHTAELASASAASERLKGIAAVGELRERKARQ